MRDEIQYPLDAGYLLRKKKSIRRTLLQGGDFLKKRIAVLGGSTTAEVKDLMELLLLRDRIQPVFYESEYNRYYEELIFPNPVLDDFAPEIIYLHTSSVNLKTLPSVHENHESIEAHLAGEMSSYQAMWDEISRKYNCPIIQNNFELPHFRGLGNLDAYDIHGRCRFITELNARFAEEARQRKNLHINDINYLAAWFGLERWYDKAFWYSYKYAMNCDALPLVADSVASIIKAIFGKTKKCLVLDLDNTLWGGVIGDDGPSGIKIGKETAEAEAYTDFQGYIKGLKERGVILAVCSKNDPANAKEGFAHPDSVLNLDDFSVFLANWDPKHENIRAISAALNIGMDSLVFIDDNPVEREIVRVQAPEVAVPEMGSHIGDYINVLDKTGYFETVSLSADDLMRTNFYAANNLRLNLQSTYANYDQFLKSLEMKAEIKPFTPLYLDRITQLINKTNQFNLTTRRYTKAEVEHALQSDRYITLYGRLTDKFGDNGLVSVMIGEIRDADLHLDLWLMSCRVLKRGLEEAMFNSLMAVSQLKNINTIYGYFYPTAKNGMVSGLFEQMGFISVGPTACCDSVWQFDLNGSYTPKNLNIEVIQ